ncbi:Rha family transcriptional regulator [Comamonas thiooxydans]
MVRDGLTLLVMALTGKKALAFKPAYIDAFQRMEAVHSRLPAFGAWS